MDLKDMIKYFEDRGFSVTFGYNCRDDSYTFLIEKRGVSVTRCCYGEDNIIVFLKDAVQAWADMYDAKRMGKTNIPFVPQIKDVIFSGPATIVKWADGTKTVVKCCEGEFFDPEKGLAIAISKKALGTLRDIRKWTEKYNESEETAQDFNFEFKLAEAAKKFENLGKRYRRMLGL